MKTEAGRLFVTRRFEAALEEFRKLSREYPKDLIITRYIGACLDHLQRDSEAIAAFQEVIRINPNDFPSRQYLAKIHMRMGNLDKAEEQLTFIVNNDARGTFGVSARGQLDTVKRLRETEKKAVPVAGRQITPQEFLKSRAAQSFMKAKYEEALGELIRMETQYPQDILIKRYKGLTLDRMKRYDEAIQAFESGLTIVPDSISIHYFLAQTHLHKKDLEAAEKEFEYVVANDESGTYKARAEQELAAIQKIQELLKKAKPKKWSINASAGIEGNSNPGSTTRVRPLRSNDPEKAWKFTNTLGGSYEIFRKGAWSSKMNYSYYQTVYTDTFAHLNVFSNSGGANLTYVKMVRGKPLIGQLGQSTSYTILRDKYYSTSFAQSLTLIYSLYEWYRITLSERWTYSTYHKDGSDPDNTSRDGFGNVLGLTNNFYLNQEKNFYFLLGLEWGKDKTQGINYVKDLDSYRTGLHFPLYYRFEGDLSFKFKDTYYPKYGFPATVPGRRDEEYTLGVTLSRPIAEKWTLNGTYNYTDNNSRDDNYTYRNHAFGMSLSYYY